MLSIISMRMQALLRKPYKKFFQSMALPALSLIGVAALAEQVFLIEIDAEAIAETVAP